MKLLFTLAFFIFYCTVTASTYYISPKGNDKNGNGSIGSPWQSLYMATSTVTTPGNIIHVMAGIYTESVRSNLAVGVSIEGDSTGSIIKSALTEDWAAILSLLSPEGTNGNQHISNLKLDGQNLSTFWAIHIAGRSNVSIYNCFITDFKDRGIVFDGRNDNTPSPPLIYATGNSFHDNVVSNCAAYNTPIGIYGRGCLNIGGQQGMLIYNNVITQDQRPNGYNGFAIKYSNDGYLKGCKIYNNTIKKRPFGGTYAGENGWDFAIEFWNILGGMEIYGNTIEGAVDLVDVSKNNFTYGVWFHHNKIARQNLNKYYESGIVFELSIEAAIVENNIFDNISGGILFNAQQYSVLTDITIQKNSFTNIGKNTGNGNNGNGINFDKGVGNYSISNVFIYDNKIIAAHANAPLYGIQISGVMAANNIQIKGNTIKNFRIGCITANPANTINKLLIENNIFEGNGNNNNPFYISGIPVNYIFKNNTKIALAAGSNPGFNIREQIVRPLYYEFKRASMLQFIAIVTCLLSLWFSRKENIYVFPMALISTSAFFFVNLFDDLPGEAVLNLCFISLLIYGWLLWNKRNRRKHRIVRITSSAKEDVVFQFLFFSVSYIIILPASLYLKKYFAPDTMPWADTFANATALTGIWLIAKKKVESWYWFTATVVTYIALYYLKHYIFISIFYVMLLLIMLLCLKRWQKKRIVKAKNDAVG
jgi:nicotinamide mononucleotide transporter